HFAPSYLLLIPRHPTAASFPCTTLFRSRPRGGPRQRRSARRSARRVVRSIGTRELHRRSDRVSHGLRAKETERVPQRRGVECPASQMKAADELDHDAETILTARIVIKAGREKSPRRRHPWIFSGAVEGVEGAPAAGETVDVVDSTGAFLARAAYSPASQIRARVMTFDADEPLDAALIRKRLEHAIALRRRLGRLHPDGACRLVFSESDRLPGLIVDHYASHLVCQFLSAGAERWRGEIVAALGGLLEPRGIHERSEGAARRKE